MKQAKEFSASELENGYELVPETPRTSQTNQNARLVGKVIGEEDPDEGMLGHDAD